MKLSRCWAGVFVSLLMMYSAFAGAQESPNLGKPILEAPLTLNGTVIYCDDGTGHAALCSSASGGGGGGGTGDASASNQTTQIARETSIRDQIGALSSPAVGSSNYWLAALNSRLGSPLQAGGSIGNTVFGATQSGTWDIRNITGALPLPAGAATAARQDALASALGSPFQAGGSVGNASFGADCMVVSADPAYTAGTNQRCSLTTAGMLRVTTNGRQESFKLVNANTPSAAVTAYGGDYIYAQVCTGYGTVALQVLDPSGSAYQTILSKTAGDTAGGTGLALGSNATVRVTVSGTTGCNVSLSRVP